VFFVLFPFKGSFKLGSSGVLTYFCGFKPTVVGLAARPDKKIFRAEDQYFEKDLKRE